MVDDVVLLVVGERGEQREQEDVVAFGFGYVWAVLPCSRGFQLFDRTDAVASPTVGYTSATRSTEALDAYTTFRTFSTTAASKTLDVPMTSKSTQPRGCSAQRVIPIITCARN